jgi:hypothetical protein
LPEAVERNVGTWTPMRTEKPQVEAPRGREYGSGVSGTEQPVVVRKFLKGNGAKGLCQGAEVIGQPAMGGTDE